MDTAPRRVVFLGHSFAPDDRALVQLVKRTLATAGCSVVSGEASEARRVSDKVRRRIASADVFVALFTRRHAVKAVGWTTSSWVVEEKAYSLGQDPDRPIILLVEEGIPIPGETGGLNGDLEYIRFERHRTEGPHRKLREMLEALPLRPTRAPG
jgi:hypothetical protein